MHEIKRQIKIINGVEILCLRLFKNSEEVGSIQQAQHIPIDEWGTWEKKYKAILLRAHGLYVV